MSLEGLWTLCQEDTCAQDRSRKRGYGPSVNDGWGGVGVRSCVERQQKEYLEKEAKPETGN